jgi:hypothetical protein
MLGDELRKALATTQEQLRFKGPGSQANYALNLP